MNCLAGIYGDSCLFYPLDNLRLFIAPPRYKLSQPTNSYYFKSCAPCGNLCSEVPNYRSTTFLKLSYILRLRKRQTLHTSYYSPTRELSSCLSRSIHFRNHPHFRDYYICLRSFINFIISNESIKSICFVSRLLVIVICCI